MSRWAEIISREEEEEVQFRAFQLPPLRFPSKVFPFLIWKLPLRSNTVAVATEEDWIDL